MNACRPIRRSSCSATSSSERPKGLSRCFQVKNSGAAGPPARRATRRAGWAPEEGPRRRTGAPIRPNQLRVGAHQPPKSQAPGPETVSAEPTSRAMHPREGTTRFVLRGCTVSRGCTWSSWFGSGRGRSWAAEAAHAVPGAEQQPGPLAAVQRDGGGGDELHPPVGPQTRSGDQWSRAMSVVAGLVVGPPRGAGGAVAARAEVAAEDQVLVELEVGDLQPARFSRFEYSTSSSIMK